MLNEIIYIFDRAFGRGQFTSDRENYQVSCPECSQGRSEKKKLHIKVDDLRYHCWVCGIKGRNALYLVRKTRPDIEIDEKKFKLKKINSESDVEEEIQISLPHNLVPIYRNSNDPDIKSVKNYLVSRGISLKKMKRWRIMAAPSGKYRRHAVIPSFDIDGNLNYYVGRCIDETNFRYKNAKRKKQEIIFNDIDIDWSEMIVLVEGVFDAINSIENTIPILGSSMTTNSLLYEKLVKNQSNVLILLDPDLPEKAYKIADMLAKAGCKVHISFPPEGKDMGDLTSQEAQKTIKEKVEYNPYMKLKHKIGTLRSGSIF